jgi:hypothetical protein
MRRRKRIMLRSNKACMSPEYLEEWLAREKESCHFQKAAMCDSGFGHTEMTIAYTLGTARRIRLSTVFAAACFMLLGMIALAENAKSGTICTNGQCFSCEGSAACVNGICTCNGVPAQGEYVHAQQGPCGVQPTIVHDNGGGRVATTAFVEKEAYVSADSAVCGNATVSAPAKLMNGSVVNGRVHVSGKSTLDGSTVNGSASVSDSDLVSSTLNGGARVSKSRLVNSTLNGAATVYASTIRDSVVNADSDIVDREIEGDVLNSR